MKGHWSRTGVVFAALYALLFVALYVHYLRRAGTWFADLPLVLASLPFTLAMRALNGGSYDFAGDMTARVMVAVLFCCVLAYGVGYVLEAVVRAVVRIIVRAARPG